MSDKKFEELQTENNPAFAYTIKGIDWDTDGEDISGLPTSVLLKSSNEEDMVIDELSDHYGWCIFGVENIEKNEVSKVKKPKL